MEFEDRVRSYLAFNPKVDISRNKRSKSSLKTIKAKVNTNRSPSQARADKNPRDLNQKELDEISQKTQEYIERYSYQPGNRPAVSVQMTYHVPDIEKDLIPLENPFVKEDEKKKKDLKFASRMTYKVSKGATKPKEFKFNAKKGNTSFKDSRRKQQGPATAKPTVESELERETIPIDKEEFRRDMEKEHAFIREATMSKSRERERMSLEDRQRANEERLRNYLKKNYNINKPE